MKKIFTILMSFVTISAFAATEPAWYNDVTSIANNGQYYIYSVNGKGFMQGGNSKVKAVTQNNYNSESNLLFTISTSNNRTYSGSNYLCSYETQTCGPVGETSTSGSTMIWESQSGYWLVYGSYTFIWAQKAYLRYEDNAYAATCLNPSLDNDKFKWHLISQAQYNRHWAIYLYDRYKETISDYTQWENLVPAAYYTALADAYAVTYNVKNAEHSKEVVNAHSADLKALYDNAAAVAEAYENANNAINALEAIEDKGEDFAEVTNDITAARTAIEEAMSVEALNAAVAGLKAIDPITFNVTTFTALELLGTPASTNAGRAISYVAADKNIINAEGLPIYKGTTTLTATAAATDTYYKFVRSAQVTVNGVDNTGKDSRVICEGEVAEYNGDTFTEATVKEYKFVNVTGGDSIVTLTVVVNKPSATSEEMTITYGDRASWNGAALSDSTVGVHYVVFETKNVNDCDSIVTLTLTVNKQQTLNVPVELAFCEGGSEEFRGVTYDVAGTFDVPAEGAIRDTLYVVNVIVNQPSASSESKTIVYGADEEWNGIALNDSTVGTHTVVYTTTNVNGCDSVVTLHLTVNKQETLKDTVEFEFCEGGSEEFRGVTYDAEGTFEVPAEGATRDTLYVVIVTVHPVYSIRENGTAKVGEGFEWQGQTIETPATGSFNYEAPYTTVNGCDSIYYLTLTVTKADVVEEDVPMAFCQGDSAEYRGEWYKIAGTYPVYAEGAERDTVYNVSVVVNEPSATSEEMTIVYGTDTTWNEMALKEETVGVHTLIYETTNVAGCDSIVTLTLTVEKLPTVETYYPIGICPGDSAEYRGKWYYESVEDTIYAEGEICDTVIYVNVVILPTSYEIQYDTVLSGYAITLPEGEWVIGEDTVSGTYPTVQSAEETVLTFYQYGHIDDGCEAIIELNVLVQSNFEAIDNIFAGEKAVKELRNGIIYIRRNGRVFTTDGRQLQ